MELVVVLVIALIVLGPKRLPEVGRSLGRGIREFKESISGDSDDEHLEREPEPKVLAQSAATAPPAAPQAVPAPAEPAQPNPPAPKAGPHPRF
jgi:sec-independent protein translocase protein TatA